MTNIMVYDEVAAKWIKHGLPADGLFDFTTSDYGIEIEGRSSELVDVFWVPGAGVNMDWNRGPGNRNAYIPIQDCATSFSIRGRATMPTTSSNGSGTIFAGLSTAPIYSPAMVYISEAGQLPIYEYLDVFGIAWNCDTDEYSQGESFVPFATDQITGSTNAGGNDFNTQYFTGGIGTEMYFDLDVSFNGSNFIQLAGTIYDASDMSVRVTGTRAATTSPSWAASPPEWKYLIFGSTIGNAGSTAPNASAVMDIFIEEIELTWL